MAIDTAEKRFSMMGVGMPFIKHVTPQGALGKPGRATMLDLYSGISLVELVVINLKHAWDYVTEDVSTFKIKTAISSLKFKVTR
tara:strand:- start:1957 stop:2208 length:252 start_codon:yes stop_codon:yes gene_type:complete